VIGSSPYPEFVYIDNKILGELFQEYVHEDIPLSLLYPIEGVQLSGMVRWGVWK